VIRKPTEMRADGLLLENEEDLIAYCWLELGIVIA